TPDPAAGSWQFGDADRGSWSVVLAIVSPILGQSRFSPSRPLTLRPRRHPLLPRWSDSRRLGVSNPRLNVLPSLIERQHGHTATICQFLVAHTEATTEARLLQSIGELLHAPYGFPIQVRELHFGHVKLSLTMPLVKFSRVVGAATCRRPASFSLPLNQRASEN